MDNDEGDDGPLPSFAELQAMQAKLDRAKEARARLDNEKKLENRRVKMGESINTSGTALAPPTPSPRKKKHVMKEGMTYSVLFILLCSYR